MTFRKVLFAYATFLFFLTGCANSSLPATDSYNWKSECAGYHQLSLPGEVDIALISTQWLLNPGNLNSGFYFPDGSDAIFSSTSYRDEDILITKQQSNDDFKLLENVVDNRVQRLITKHYTEEPKTVYKTIKPDAFTWIGPEWFSSYIHRNDHMYHYALDSDGQPPLQMAEQFLERFKARQTFEIPNERGICFPHGFIADRKNHPHNIAVTLRLKAHPDVEIFFQDESATPPQYTQSGKLINYNAEEVIRDFLRGDYDAYAKRAVADSRGFHSISMAGREGKAIFVTLTRHDGATDYGYVAYVKGVYEAEKDTPNLMLYVMRTAANSNTQPTSKEEIRSIAEKIVSSVKRRVPE